MEVAEEQVKAKVATASLRRCSNDIIGREVRTARGEEEAEAVASVGDR